MVKHIMSDGTRRESIEGLVVPAEHPVYKVIQAMEERIMANEVLQRTRTA